MAVFNGSLYVGTYNENSNKPGQIWRSANGTTWAPVMQNGFGSADNLSVLSLYSYRGALYTVTSNAVTGNQVWKSPDGTTWTKTAPDGLGDSNNNWMMRGYATTVFKDSLYMALLNGASGVEVWQMISSNILYLPITHR